MKKARLGFGFGLYLLATLATAFGDMVTVRPLSTTLLQPLVGHMDTTHIRLELAEPVRSLDDRALRIAISENLPRGAGDALRGSVWMAAAVAGRTVGDPLADRSFILDVKGNVDGSSAAALYAVGMIAALRGERIMTNATMTGTILPDGSIGEVGGLRQKLEAAKAGGMRKVIVPSGSRIDFDFHTAEILDVGAFGSDLGLDIVFADDVDKAYFELTGNLLTPPSIVPEGRDEITLPADLMRLIREQTLQLSRKARDLLQALGEIDPGQPDMPESQKSILRDAIGQARATIIDNQHRGIALMQEGEWIAAHSRITMAYVAATALVSWKDAGFAMLDDDGRSAIIQASLAAIEDRKQADPQACGHVEAAILNARMLGDVLDLLLPDVIHYEIQQDLQDAMQAPMQEAGEQEQPEAIHPETAAPDGLQLDNLPYNLYYAHQAHLYKATGEFFSGADPVTDTADPAQLLPSLLFRNSASTRAPPSLDPEATELWFQFVQTRYQSMCDAVRAQIAHQEQEMQSSLAYDPRVRRPLLLEEFRAGLGPEEPPDPDEPEQDEDARVQTLFEQAVFLSREEAGMAAYLIRTNMEESSGMTAGQGPWLRGGSLRRHLARASSHAKRAISQAQWRGHDVIAPRYDYLLAQGLAHGDVDEQFQALQLYWQAAATCQLVEACTRP